VTESPFPDVTLGDTVIYTLTDAWRPSLHNRTYPAIVHQFNEDGTADLTVFTSYGQSVFTHVPRGNGTANTWSLSDTFLAD
jgi:hypothetical protein